VAEINPVVFFVGSLQKTVTSGLHLQFESYQRRKKGATGEMVTEITKRSFNFLL
jgi:hypothetical protein